MKTQRAVQPAQPWNLLRKVVLLLLLVLAVAEGLVLLRDRGNPAPVPLFNILADASIGAVTGVGSRVVLRRRSWWLKALVSASLSIVGLIALGILTQSASGIGPLYADLVRVDWLDSLGLALRVPGPPRNASTDLMDAAHMIIAIDVSWIALRAWPVRGRPSRGQARAGQPRAGHPSMGIRVPVSARAGLSGVARRAAPAARWVTGGRRVMRQTRIGSGGSLRATAIRRRASPRQRRNFIRRRAAVQIARYEQHRCPYCLQDIRRNDEHGLVECPICHTLHHKDCWDITGTCQVPHLNA